MELDPLMIYSKPFLLNVKTLTDCSLVYRQFHLSVEKLPNKTELKMSDSQSLKKIQAKLSPIKWDIIEEIQVTVVCFCYDSSSGRSHLTFLGLSSL